MDEQEQNISKSDQELVDKGRFKAELILKYNLGEITEEEFRILEELNEQTDDARTTFSELTNPAPLNEGLDLLKEFAKKAEQRKTQLMSSISPNGVSQKKPVRRLWKVMTIAAILLVVFGAGLFWKLRNPVSDPQTAAVDKTPDNILPGGKKAILIIDNGKALDLTHYTDSLFAENGIRLKNNEGRLVYDPGPGSGRISYHTIVVPKGGEYQVMLEDGTKIWLNAASSIRYPTQFAANERSVELTGEAYFEVVKNPQRPFKVLVDSMLVTVTGTEFNINAYRDEALLKSTLFNGKVRISKSAIAVDLVPGQQLQLDRSNNDVRIVERPDLEAVIAWKDGLFKLTSADIPTIMRQVARWYDIEIVYKNGIIPQGHISGMIPRNLNLSEILKVLEESGVKFEFQGNKLTILP
jgi:transmembrane sensor